MRIQLRIQLRGVVTFSALLVVSFCYTVSAQDGGLSRGQMVARIDEAIEAQCKTKGIELAESCSDAEFLRRVYLDLTGVVPRPADLQRFLQQKPEDRRQLAIDELLDSPGYATHMANTWRSLMLPNALGPEEIFNVLGVQNWLRRQFVANARYDRLVADLIVASGGGQQGPALFYTANNLEPAKIAAATARMFLGIQLECAQCHDHPHDRWTQRDFWGYAAFFGQLSRTDVPRRGAFRLVDNSDREVTLPESDEVVQPKYPGGSNADVGAGGTRRTQLAIWMSSKENPYLPKAAVNLIWAQMFGRGLVNPIDDIGPRNPASHPQLFDELSRYFVKSGYDVKELIRTIALTKAYQRTSKSKKESIEAERWYARRSVKPMSADQFYASLERLQARPTTQGNRFQDLLQPEKQAFLSKLRRQSRDATEYDGGVPQALTLMNGKEIERVTDPRQSGILGALEAPWLDDRQRTDLLFMATLSRAATPKESDVCRKILEKSKDRRKALGDILWSLVNSAEFAFNH